MQLWRALRRRILTPHESATSLDVRGFHVKSPAARDRLETIGRTFLQGYAYAAQARQPLDAEEELETVPMEFRGFAYEGAAMAFAMRDGLSAWGGGHLPRFLGGRGADHVYMVYVGIGWAMARLPRLLWSRLHVPDPLLRWLALDGYGFHQAYFRTQQYVHDRFQEGHFPWPAGPTGWYANRAIDQGIGRALWFVGGTDVGMVADLISRFPEHRRPDLISGVGLAATYAGGAEAAELSQLRDVAQGYGPELAQGAAFAAAARVRAGLVVPHNDLATEVFCGMSAVAAAKVTDVSLVEEPGPPGDPLYELWRSRIAAAFVDAQGSSSQ